jgi:hypothetical protein
VAWWQWLILAATVAAGAFFRIMLARMAPGFWYDEAIYALDGLRVLREPGWPVFFDTYGHMREPLFIYMLAATFGAFGPSVEAARLTAAAVGTLTLLAMFGMARGLYRSNAWALAATGILAALAWHVRFSGLCFRTVTAPLFATLAFWALVRAARLARPRDAVLAGALLGAGAYTYLSWRLVPVMLAAWGVWALWRMRHEALAPWLRLAGWGAGAALLVAAPLLVHFARHPDHFRGRTDEVTLSGHGRPAWKLVATQARDVALMPLLRGDHVGKHNIPGRMEFVQTRLWPTSDRESMRGFLALPDPHGHGLPLFDPLTGVLFYLGLGAVAVRAWRGSLAHGGILAWLLVGSLASVLSYGAPNMLRLTVVAPAVVLVLTEGMRACAPFAGRVLEVRLLRLAVWPLLAGIQAYAVSWQATAGLHWIRNPLVIREFNPELRELAISIRACVPGKDIPIVVPEIIADAPTLRFAADGYRIVSDATEQDLGTSWIELHTVPPVPPVRSRGVPSGAPDCPVGFFGRLVVMRKGS